MSVLDQEEACSGNLMCCGLWGQDAGPRYTLSLNGYLVRLLTVGIGTAYLSNGHSLHTATGLTNSKDRIVYVNLMLVGRKLLFQRLKSEDKEMKKFSAFYGEKTYVWSKSK